MRFQTKSKKAGYQQYLVTITDSTEVKPTVTVMIENTPIDYLDFASPVSGLGSKMGMDATNKWPGETTREWGEPIAMTEDVKKRVDELWDTLGIESPASRPD